MVEVQLRDELAARQLLCKPACMHVGHIHPLGAIPKSVTEVRIIHDLSSPEGRAVNDFIAHKKYTWASLDDALHMITPRCWMARVDPADWPLTAFEWQLAGDARPTVLVDPYLQFGQRNAPEVAHRFTLAILAIMRHKGVTGIVGIVDDFLVMAATYAECRRAWLALITTLQHCWQPY